MSMQNKDWLCHILASITIVLWASSYVLPPYALQSYSPTALSLLRYMFGAAALVIFGCIKRIGLPKLRDVPKFFLAGALGITVYMAVSYTHLDVYKRQPMRWPPMPAWEKGSPPGRVSLKSEGPVSLRGSYFVLSLRSIFPSLKNVFSSFSPAQ